MEHSLRNKTRAVAEWHMRAMGSYTLAKEMKTSTTVCKRQLCNFGTGSKMVILFREFRRPPC